MIYLAVLVAIVFVIVTLFRGQSLRFLELAHKCRGMRVNAHSCVIKNVIKMSQLQ
jgi:hypothetical protein